MGSKILAFRSVGTLLFLFVSSVALADRGAQNPDVTQATIAQTICAPGYTQSVRLATSFTNGVKQLLLKRSCLDPLTASDYELDHIIPLARGSHPCGLDNLELQPWPPQLRPPCRRRNLATVHRIGRAPWDEVL